MKICPKCGLPFSGEPLVGADVKCDYCGWKGSSFDLLHAESDKFQQEDLAKLRELFIFLANEISPLIMRRLIQQGFFEADTTEVGKMVPILAKTSRAMFSALIEGLCGSEIEDDGETKVGRTVHP